MSQPEEVSMTSRSVAALFALAAVGLVPPHAMAQAPSAKPSSNVPRTPDGKPDLQGFWDFRTLTPLERPASQANKPFLTEAEARALQDQNADRRDRAAGASEPRTAPRAAGGGGQAVGAYNDFWIDGG